MIEMAKGTFSILIAAVPSAATSAVFQIAIVVSDGWIRAHLPPYMPYLWGLCAVLWGWWVIAKFLRYRPNSAPNDPFENHGNLAGRDNTGVQISHSVIGDSALDKLLKAEATATDAPPVSLRVEKPEFTPLHRTHTTWQLAAPEIDGVLGAVAWIHNAAPEEGEKAESINSAIASVVYRGDNCVLASVPTAYWLGEFANEVDIRIDQR